MAKETKTVEQYLLILSYPACDHPIGLFPTADAALRYAADHPPPADPGDMDRDLEARFINQWAAFEDYNRAENRRPNGYIIQKFVDGGPLVWSAVEPYNERDVVHPNDPSPPDPDRIDPDQELDWN